MIAAKSLRWGDWAKQRARTVGIIRFIDLAYAIGCHQNHITRIVQAELPPNRMTKGLDAALIRVLQTDRQTLFIDWRSSSPEAAPMIDPNIETFDAPILRRKVQAIAELLGPTQLGELHEKGRALLAGASAA